MKPPTDATHATVKFYPQVWDRNDRALTGAPFTYTVPIEDATDDNGELLEDDSYSSDQLHRHENAPDEVRNWQGPFYVEIDEVIER